ncbi:sugar ABC transporter ATP-binding protein [Cellulomonas hominis]|nr:sugar ABC transporter ATP-binding protein [Cellulomonas hominis]
MPLELVDITHDYGDGPVLHDVSFAVRPGQVHALLGVNGAGKSTLVHVATGVLRPTAGRVVLDGAPARFAGQGDANRAGVALLSQEVDRALVASMTVHENLTVGLLRARGARGFRPRANREEARALLARYGVDLDVDRLVQDLSLFEKQVLSLVRAVASDARFVVLDEPLASLGISQTAEVLNMVERLRESGLGVVMISHSMVDVQAVADRIVVLRLGRINGDFDAQHASYEDLIAAITGITPTGRLARPTRPAAL